MFFFPLFDDNPSSRTPYISWLIIALCVLVFVWQQSLGPQGEQYAFYTYGFVPAHVSGAVPLPAQLVVLPAWATAISSMFLHGGLMHIGGNMLYLWIFGDNIEDSMGPLKFIIFYILCGMAAAAAQFAIDPASRIPMVGASGGIAGILGAYLILHPKAAIRTLLVILVFIRFINLPAWLVLGVWIGGQFVAVPNALANDGGGVAYFAHIGGFIAGMILVPFFKHRDIPLFGGDDSPPTRWNGQPVPFSTIRAQASAKYRGRRNALGSRVVSPDHNAPPHQAATDQEYRTDREDPQQSGPWAEPGRKSGGSVPRHRRKTRD
ncbi:MAG: rhomboid family intramembrane serine protease [Rhodospirillaceae bacterium]|nr:rhomboid family intramembrane serine protease [Rhodospirillaceae bacterium]